MSLYRTLSALLIAPVLLLIFTQMSFAQGKISQTVYFEVTSGGSGLENQIFRQPIEGVILRSTDTAQVWKLYQEKNGQWEERPSQLETGAGVFLYGYYTDSKAAGEKIRLRWQQEKGESIPGIRIKDTGKSLDFMKEDQLLISYRYAMMPAPEGVSSVYGKSGYVHPLLTPGGNLLSRIQPPDHYHHYGLWHPWTRTGYNGEEIDFWNLNLEQGTVSFSDILSIREGPLFSEITVVQDHIVHPGRGAQTVLKETLTYRIWNIPEGQDYYLMDVIYHMNPSTELPLTILAYRYQGFSLRGPAHWADDNVGLLTSAGKNKTNGNGTRARWMKVTGPGNQSGMSSVAMMTHPCNYNFPEQIRIWPTGMNRGKENVFINFNPAQEQDWKMEPHQTYTLQYRVIAADRDFTKEEMDQLWESYSGMKTEKP